MTVTRAAATSAPFSLPLCSTCRGSTVINWSIPAAQVSGMEVMRHASTFLRPPPLPPAADGPAPSYALVVLNQRLPRFAPDLWSHATLRIFADGGANRVFDGMPKFFPEQDPLEIRNFARGRDWTCVYFNASLDSKRPFKGLLTTLKYITLRYKPDVIRGDLDSIRPEVKEFYSNLGVKVEDVSYDQDTTDLHKCVAFICDFTPEVDKPNLCILVAGALGGRFDHEAGNLNILYKFSNIQIVLLSDDCLIQLLPKTHCHEIHIQSSVEGPHCGLIPVGAPSVSTTTTGLRWDLTDAGMSFGGLISTSNMVCKERITVRSDSDLLWTISIKKKT